MELSTVISQAGVVSAGSDHCVLDGWLKKKDTFSWYFLSSRVLLYCSQIMPHLERKNELFQKVQKEA